MIDMNKFRHRISDILVTKVQYQDGTKWLLALVIHVIQAVDPPATIEALLLCPADTYLQVSTCPKEFERN